ncbi:hypothetical protein [Sulfitobacter guttiformis]|uniref:Uncharacterized protein n=1 Tax=Sulfitobacter guttiformis TaxID=74349 RepID=A0A420DJ63_9RHOB|nr:hypothetical protein [Sulfitobacter guttiformis]KIN71940.1 hypothetical protein Z949_1106 [Sulfitobacter guttiformis KCTC 32187]RKE94258.1 hypothetical protein C8N30_3378 [Sulfitobacter guttiformis]
MARLAKATIQATKTPQKETPLEKTTRISRRMNNDEAEVRHVKTARLRKARFESAAATPDELIAGTSNAEGKKR